MSEFVMVWPVLDLDRPLSALITEADPLLHDALVDADLKALRRPLWRLADGFNLPDAQDGTVLTARLPVAAADALDLPLTDRDARLVAVHEMTRKGMGATEIAAELRVSRRQILRDRESRPAVT